MRHLCAWIPGLDNDCVWIEGDRSDLEIFKRISLFNGNLAQEFG